jgi:hypothetical protein
VAHAGFLHLAGNAALLRAVAGFLGPLGGHVDLYTMHTDADLAYKGLVPPGIRRVGYFPAHEMAERVAATADALLLTASFEERDRAHESTLFPSKLADYTGIGLPIVVWGPAYSSAARWFAANPGAGALVTERDPQAVQREIERLAGDREHACTIAAAGVAAGRKDFELSVTRGKFFRALVAAR